MLVPVLLIVCLALFLLIYYSRPLGDRLREILHLPGYWLQLRRTDTSSMQAERIAYGTHSRQYFLLAPPADPTIRKPEKLVVHIHGGGWTFGRPEQFKANTLAFHEAGYPVILPSLRRAPLYNYYHLREDLNQLLKAIVQLQAEKGWTGQRIVLTGMSSGANLAALLCFDRRALSAIGLDQSVFAGLLVLGGPLALEKMRHSLVLQAFAGRRGSTQFVLADPVRHLPGSAPIPVFCIHGCRDGLVEFESAAAFVEAYAGIHPGMVRFVVSEQGTHLQAAAWHHPKVNLKEEILMWLKKL